MLDDADTCSAGVAVFFRTSLLYSFLLLFCTFVLRSSLIVDTFRAFSAIKYYCGLSSTERSTHSKYLFILLDALSLRPPRNGRGYTFWKQCCDLVLKSPKHS